MPYTWTLTDDGRGLVQVGSGVVTGAELLAACAANSRAHEGAEWLTHGLVDLAEVTSLQASTAELRRLAEESRVAAKFAPGAHVALVAPRDLVYGLARMWEVFATETGWTTQVFRDRASAEAWLAEQLAGTGEPPA